MVNLTIKSTEHLRGMIDMLIYQYDLNQFSLSDEYCMGFDIKKIESTYNVEFNWCGEWVTINEGEEHEPDKTQKQYDDCFSIKQDESLSKLDQFVTDILHDVRSTELTKPNIL